MLQSVSRRASALALAAVVLAAVPAVASPSAVPGPDGGGLRVVVNCYSNPERVRVTNLSSHRITIRTVGSIYRPYSSEPFSKHRNLGAGDGITFFSGFAANNSNPNTLTRRYIFNNEVGTREGARVRTTTGARYIDRCG